jgi:hypothetical protein
MIRNRLCQPREHRTASQYFFRFSEAHRYPPAVWGDDEEVDDDDEWDVGGYEDEYPSLAEAAFSALAEQERRGGGGDDPDGMNWEEAPLLRSHLPGTAEEQRLQQELRAQQLQQQKQQ